MTRRHLYRLAFVASIVAAMACGTINNLVEQGQSAQATVEAIATQGNEIAATAQAMATELEGSGFQQTAEALATELEQGGLAETAQALATEAQGSGLAETAQAVATEGSLTLGEAPDDIPVMEGEKSLFFGTEEVVSYFIDADYDDVLAFYKQEMPANDWQPVASETVEAEGSAVLVYEKADRKAYVTLSQDPVQGNTIVQVTIQPK